jgi:hypothetical protein
LPFLGIPVGLPAAAIAALVIVRRVRDPSANLNLPQGRWT